MAHQVAEPTLDNTYLIQDTFVDIMLQRGVKVVGWKVATSKAMGVLRPIIR